MSVSKLKDGSGWKVYIRYVDWQGKKQVHTKQTFETKRDALNYERDFIQKKSRDIQMNFAKFVEIYLEDIKPRIKLNTFMTKKHIIETKILPYFENKSLAEIDSTDVIQWQNVLLCARDENDRGYVIALIDDASRFITGIDVFFNDTFVNLMSVMKSAISKYGKPKVFNFDNGSSYKNKQMELLAARIGTTIHLRRRYLPYTKNFTQRAKRTGG